MNSTAQRWWLALSAAAFGLLLLLTGTRDASAAGIAPQETRSVAVSQAGTDDNERPSFYGIIQRMPTSGMTGEWLIGDRIVIANPQTRFRQEAGPLGVNGCAEVELVARGSNIARKIESKNLSHCTGNGNDDGDGDSDSNNDVYGLVESIPAGGRVGVWTVSSRQYTVTEQSELKRDHGIFDIGKCVEIELVSGTTDRVRKMETERSYKCASGNDDSEEGVPGVSRGEIYGELMSLPDPASGSLAGTWIVGTMTFSATENTEFNTRNGKFVVGGIVKVEFVILQDGTFLAREIKTAIAGPDDGDDGSGHSDDRGRAFGVIDQLPDGARIGTWIIAGIEYSATERTEFHDDANNFAVGQRVKVEFLVDENGVRIAREIKIIGVGGDQGQIDNKFVGFVDSMPDAGFVGLWVVNGVEFSGTVQSKFREEHGSFAVGAYAKIEYLTMDGVNIIHAMKTEVPPGAGDDDTIGTIENVADTPTAAAVNADVTWVIGGENFIVTTSTQVSSAISTADTVWVNSYAAVDGSQVATRIVSVSLTNSLFLPVMRR